jgi:DNA-binding phage protein
MAIALTQFDETDVAGYLNDMLAEDGDIAAVTQHALGNAVRWGIRTYGAEKFCTASGLNRRQIQREVRMGGESSLTAVFAIAGALGLGMQFVPEAEGHSEAHSHR